MLIPWYFDIISPFAYLQLRDLKNLPSDLSILPVPVLFAGLLKAHGHKGPGEIPAKRIQTYRSCVFRAQQLGMPFKFPPAHPFNPLPIMRLLCAAGLLQTSSTDQHPQFSQVVTAFDMIWGQGGNPADPAVFQSIASASGIPDAEAAISDPAVRQRLVDNTQQAVDRGIYGVPTLEYQGELFWGSDIHDMFMAFVRHPSLFREGELHRVSELPSAASRRPA